MEDFQWWWHIHIFNQVIFVEFLLSIKDLLGQLEGAIIILLLIVDLDIESIGKGELLDLSKLLLLHLFIFLKGIFHLLLLLVLVLLLIV